LKLINEIFLLFLINFTVLSIYCSHLTVYCQNLC